GAGVILCSHLLSEIEEICDDVVIMNEGQVVAKGTVGEVVGQTQPSQAGVVRLHVPAGSVGAAMQALAGVNHVTARMPADETSGWLTLQVEVPDEGSIDEDQRRRNAVLRALIDADVPVLGFEVGGGRLQDVFLQLTAETIQ
ncbi:MAG: hypothetical protein WAN48_05485, partial [Actinomycetes bacterium]